MNQHLMRQELSEEALKRISPDGTFSVQLPNWGKASTTTEIGLTLRMLKGSDEKALTLGIEKRRSHNLMENLITEQLKKIIVSVNGNDDPAYVDSFVDSLLARHAKFIREEYARLVPDVDLKTSYECRMCDSVSEINIPFSAEFFWPIRS